ncbi:MAG: hypothetical protein ABR607_06260 [Pyrinomonadaceae bacterium]
MNPKHMYKALIALTLIISVSCLFPRRTIACGPFFTDAIFVFTKHPDFPLENFANGKLGVVTATWARSYLVVAYRTLAGNGLSESEAKAVKSLWDDRLNLTETSDDSGTTKWIEARKRVPGAAAITEVQTYRNREKPREYEEFLNCQQDAFRTATANLDERVGRFGADSNQVRDWLAAQDMVFANCHEGNRIPQLPVNQDALVRADRMYQIAAANFYSTNYDEAAKQFDAITKDKTSPYHIVSPYLAARAMLRKGSFAEKAEDARPALAEAEDRLNAILKDSSLKLSHHAAARLANLVRLRLHPEEKLHELAHALMKKDATDDFKQSVWDYTALFDKFVGDDEEGKKQQIPAGVVSDDLSDWIIAIQRDNSGVAAHAMQRWEQTRSVPWLVAALLNADAKDPKLNEILTAAAAVNASSPAFATLTFHRVRLLKETNRIQEAREVLDRTLGGDRQQLAASALNLLLSERMTMAQNLEEFLQSAQRRAAGFSDDNDGREIPMDAKEAEQAMGAARLLFDLDAANVFNKAMPVAVMKEAARDRHLAPNLRQDTAQASFARAALLDERETAVQSATLLQDFYPQMKEFLTAYERATTADARRFAAAFLSLKFPGVRPFVSAGIGRTSAMDAVDSYRDNYWCAEPPTSQAGPPAEEDPDEQNRTHPVVVPEFLKGSQSIAARQFAALQALGTGPNYLCRIAIEWTEKNPTDPRSPEALHLAVRSTRYGCTDKDTGRWSKAAFDLLHRRYPNTTWANNTKYWFKG